MRGARPIDITGRQQGPQTHGSAGTRLRPGETAFSPLAAKARAHAGLSSLASRSRGGPGVRGLGAGGLMFAPLHPALHWLLIGETSPLRLWQAPTRAGTLPPRVLYRERERLVTQILWRTRLLTPRMTGGFQSPEENTFPSTLGLREPSRGTRWARGMGPVPDRLDAPMVPRGPVPVLVTAPPEGSHPGASEPPAQVPAATRERVDIREDARGQGSSTARSVLAGASGGEVSSRWWPHQAGHFRARAERLSSLSERAGLEVAQRWLSLQPRQSLRPAGWGEAPIRVTSDQFLVSQGDASPSSSGVLGGPEPVPGAALEPTGRQDRSGGLERSSSRTSSLLDSARLRLRRQSGAIVRSWPGLQDSMTPPLADASRSPERLTVRPGHSRRRGTGGGLTPAAAQALGARWLTLVRAGSWPQTGGETGEKPSLSVEPPALPLPGASGAGAAARFRAGAGWKRLRAALTAWASGAWGRGEAGAEPWRRVVPVGLTASGVGGLATPVLQLLEGPGTSPSLVLATGSRTSGESTSTLVPPAGRASVSPVINGSKDFEEDVWKNEALSTHRLRLERARRPRSPALGSGRWSASQSQESRSGEGRAGTGRSPVGRFDGVPREALPPSELQRESGPLVVPGAPPKLTAERRWPGRSVQALLRGGESAGALLPPRPGRSAGSDAGARARAGAGSGTSAPVLFALRSATGQAFLRGKAGAGPVLRAGPLPVQSLLLGGALQREGETVQGQASPRLTPRTGQILAGRRSSTDPFAGESSGAVPASGPGTLRPSSEPSASAAARREGVTTTARMTPAWQELRSSVLHRALTAGDRARQAQLMAETALSEGALPGRRGSTDTSPGFPGGLTGGLTGARGLAGGPGRAGMATRSDAERPATQGGLAGARRSPPVSAVTSLAAAVATPPGRNAREGAGGEWASTAGDTRTATGVRWLAPLQSWPGRESQPRYGFSNVGRERARVWRMGAAGEASAGVTRGSLALVGGPVPSLEPLKSVQLQVVTKRVRLRVPEGLPAPVTGEGPELARAASARTWRWPVMPEAGQAPLELPRIPRGIGATTFRRGLTLGTVGQPLPPGAGPGTELLGGVETPSPPRVLTTGSGRRSPWPLVAEALQRTTENRQPPPPLPGRGLPVRVLQAAQVRPERPLGSGGAQTWLAWSGQEAITLSRVSRSLAGRALGRQGAAADSRSEQGAGARWAEGASGGRSSDERHGRMGAQSPVRPLTLVPEVQQALRSGRRRVAWVAGAQAWTRADTPAGTRTQDTGAGRLTGGALGVAEGLGARVGLARGGGWSGAGAGSSPNFLARLPLSVSVAASGEVSELARGGEVLRVRGPLHGVWRRLAGGTLAAAGVGGSFRVGAVFSTGGDNTQTLLTPMPEARSLTLTRGGLTPSNRAAQGIAGGGPASAEPALSLQRAKRIAALAVRGRRLPGAVEVLGVAGPVSNRGTVPWSVPGSKSGRGSAGGQAGAASFGWPQSGAGSPGGALVRTSLAYLAGAERSVGASGAGSSGPVSAGWTGARATPGRGAVWGETPTPTEALARRGLRSHRRAVAAFGDGRGWGEHPPGPAQQHLSVGAPAPGSVTGGTTGVSTGVATGSAIGAGGESAALPRPGARSERSAGRFLRTAFRGPASRVAGAGAASGSRRGAGERSGWDGAGGRGSLGGQAAGWTQGPEAGGALFEGRGGRAARLPAAPPLQFLMAPESASTPGSEARSGFMPGDKQAMERQFLEMIARRQGPGAAAAVQEVLASGQRFEGRAPVQLVDPAMGVERRAERRSSGSRPETTAQTARPSLGEAELLQMLRALASSTPEAQGLLRDLSRELDSLRRVSGLRKV